MEKKYFLQPEKKMWKQGFFMNDENEKTVYEAKVLKQSLLGSQTVEFVNHVSNKSQQHKIGAVVTIETESGGFVNVLSKRSYFKYDGKKIWDHLHELGVRIDTGMASGKLGYSYTVTLKGQPMATITTSTPKGKAIITGKIWLDVVTSEEHLDLAFLTAYAIARTEQVFYN